MRHSSVRGILVCGLTAVAFALAGCSSDSSPSGNGNGTGNGNGNGNGEPVETTSVDLEGIAIDPEHIKVAPGATVTWTFLDSEEHNVTFDDSGIQDSEDQNSGTYSTAMPTTPGTYDYECTLHPIEMQGSVTVE